MASQLWRRLAAYSIKEINLKESLSFRIPFAIITSLKSHLTSVEKMILEAKY